MTAPICDRCRPRGFTLVELITVIAILGILVTLTVSAVQGVRNYVSRKATEEIFAALDAALQRYCADWGRFPDTVDTRGQSDYGQVNTAYAPLGMSNSQSARDAMLYAVLTMTQRGGPYFRGSEAQARILRAQDGTQYHVFVDGWGREIRYMPPDFANTNPRTGLRGATPSWRYPGTGKPAQPVLESLGADEAADDDNLVNYGYLRP